MRSPDDTDDPWSELGLPTVLAANVQRMRKAKGYSQESLARRSWLTRETIRSVERGDANVRISTVERIALALGVAPVALLRETEATRAYLHAVTSLSPHLAVIERRGRGRTDDAVQPPLVNALP